MKELLKKLRAQLKKLESRAASIETRMADGMEPADLARAESQHAELVDDIADMKRSIEETEAQIRATDDAPPADTVQSNGTDGTRAAEILSIGTRAGIDTAVIEEALRNNVAIDDFRRTAFDAMVSRQGGGRTSPIRVERDEMETRRHGIEIAMRAVATGAALSGTESEMAQDFRSYRDTADFAAAFMNERAMPRSVAERERILERAFHVTSDFPAIFSSVINTTLEQSYAVAEPTFRRIARNRSFADFRAHSVVDVSLFPSLELVPESGNITYGTLGENKETVTLFPYAKALSISRQMLVNDRLGAIAQVVGDYGTRIALFEEATFYAMMLSANTKLSDNQVVFHSSHNNLAGSGAAITVASLGAARAAMRKQTGLKDEKLNIVPRILLVSPDKETEADQLVASITANDSVKVNPFSGRLEVVTSAHLEGNAWYLFADPASFANYQWGLLDGYEAPRMRIEEPFGKQGVSISIEHDFGCGATGFRAGYKNPGA